jgi:hypothetical protein
MVVGVSVTPGGEEAALDDAVRQKYALRLVASLINTAHRFPFVASEIMCCSIAEVMEAFLADTTLLDRMWNFLAQPAPLSPLLASYLVKTMCAFLSRSPKEV